MIAKYLDDESLVLRSQVVYLSLVYLDSVNQYDLFDQFDQFDQFELILDQGLVVLVLNSSIR